ncbi:hypothetical protein [Halomonas garicola]|uniref:hypothetical protein n=1 Tax=Halomonas garicola TaxID=1690008 RepID=UPI0028A24F98|nr:hypothetical protein [Halomonas garicola]
MQSTTFQKGMAYLAAAYGTELSRERLAVYWDQLRQLDDQTFLGVTKAIVAQQRFFPTVAEIRERYREACAPQVQVYRLPRPKRQDAAYARSVLQALKTEVHRP